MNTTNIPINRFTIIFIIIILSVNYSCKEEEVSTPENIIEIFQGEAKNSSTLYPMVSYYGNLDSTTAYFLGNFSNSQNPLNLKYSFIIDNDFNKMYVTYFINYRPYYSYIVDTRTSLRVKKLIEYDYLTDQFKINIYEYDWYSNKGELEKSILITKNNDNFGYEIVFESSNLKHKIPQKNNYTRSEFYSYEEFFTDYYNNLVYDGLEWFVQSGNITTIWNDMQRDVSLSRMHAYMVKVKQSINARISENSFIDASPSVIGTVEQLLRKLSLSDFEYIEIKTDKINTIGYVKIDGKNYSTIKIGEQVWLGENLVATHDNEGNEVVVYDYDNKPETSQTYGKLYPHSSLTNLCPEGWRVPTDADWLKLSNNLGGDINAGAFLKPGGYTQFNALLAGYRAVDGSYRSIGLIGSFWTSTLVDDKAISYSINSNNDNLARSEMVKKLGFSVRCIKN